MFWSVKKQSWFCENGATVKTNMKKLITSIVFFLSIPAYANISTKEADYSLLTHPPTKYVQPDVVAYNIVENYTKPMLARMKNYVLVRVISITRLLKI